MQDTPGLGPVLPPHAQRLPVLRALKSLAMVDGSLHPKEARLLEIAAEAMRLEVDLDDVAPITPSELAESLTDRPSRVALLKRLVLLSTLDAEVSEPEVILLEQYAAALEVEERAVHNLRQLLQGHLRRMAFDLGRRSFAPALLGTIWSRDGLAGLWKFARVALGLEDATAAARFEELGRLPEDTLGYGVYHQFVDNGFPYSGQRYGAPDHALFHDVGHVLAGYDTSPGGELQVAGFQAGYLQEDPLVMYLMIAMLYQLGIEEIAEKRHVTATKGLLDIDEFEAAYRRGRALKVNLLEWDPWPHMARPLAEVRAELGLPPGTPPTPSSGPTSTSS